MHLNILNLYLPVNCDKIYRNMTKQCILTEMPFSQDFGKQTKGFEGICVCKNLEIINKTYRKREQNGKR